MIHTITIDRPQVRNALDLATLDRIDRALDEPARVFVLTGAGEKVFYAGADLSEVAGNPEGRREAARRYARLLARVAASERPVVARVNGHCLAGGLGLVLACDLAVCVEDAQFSLPEAGVGMWPMMVGAFLLRTVPRKLALELAMTGRRLSAQEALHHGLVNRVVPRAELDAAVEQLCASLVAQSPSALRVGRRAWNDALALPVEPGLELLAERLGDLMDTEDAAEGFLAFLQKRKPEWRDR